MINGEPRMHHRPFGNVLVILLLFGGRLRISNTCKSQLSEDKYAIIYFLCLWVDLVINKVKLIMVNLNLVYNSTLYISRSTSIIR